MKLERGLKKKRVLKDGYGIGSKRRREYNRVHETRKQKGDESKGPLESK